MKHINEILRPAARRALAPDRQVHVWLVYNGVRLKDLAEELGISLGTLGRVVSGHSKSRPTAQRILEHTGVDIYDDAGR